MSAAPVNRIIEDDRHERFRAEVADRFVTRTTDPFVLDELKVTRDRFQRIAVDLVDRTPQSRELALALTALEEAKFWANQALARHGLREVTPA